VLELPVRLVLRTVRHVNMVEAARDGRSARWDAHRAARRDELVGAALAAVRRHGPGVAMEDVAAQAGTSKTVVYRYFADKGQLYLTVCARVAELLLERLRAAMAGEQGPREVLAGAVDAYLAFVEEDPEVYRFVVHPPLPDRPPDADPVADLTALIGDQVSAVLAARLGAAGLDTAVAGPWGHGLVGLVRAAGDHWVATGAGMPRAELTSHLTALAWSGLQAAATPEER
jgi:AcrR family transcriptional regulator